MTPPREAPGPHMVDASGPRLPAFNNDHNNFYNDRSGTGNDNGTGNGIGGEDPVMRAYLQQLKQQYDRDPPNNHNHRPQGNVTHHPHRATLPLRGPTPTSPHHLPGQGHGRGQGQGHNTHPPTDDMRGGTSNQNVTTHPPSGAHTNHTPDCPTRLQRNSINNSNQLSSNNNNSNSGRAQLSNNNSVSPGRRVSFSSPRRSESRRSESRRAVSRRANSGGLPGRDRGEETAGGKEGEEIRSWGGKEEEEEGGIRPPQHTNLVTPSLRGSNFATPSLSIIPSANRGGFTRVESRIGVDTLGGIDDRKGAAMRA